MKHIVKNIIFMLNQTHNADKSFMPINTFVHMLRLITPLTSVLGLKFIIDSLTQDKSFKVIVLIVCIYCMLNIFKGMIEAWYNNKYMPVASVKISQYLDIKLMKKTIGLDLASFDDSEFYDKYMRAKNEINTRAISVVTTICEIIGGLFSIATLFAVVMIIEPVLLICVAVGVVLSFIVDIIRSKVFYHYSLETTKVNRKISYIQRIFYEPQYLKELRLFNISELSMRKYHKNTKELVQILKKQGKKKFLLAVISLLLESGLFVFCSFIYLGFRVFTKAITIGDFSAMYNAVFQFGNELYTFVNKFPTLYQHSLFIDNLTEVLTSSGSVEEGGKLKLDAKVPHSVQFVGVSFSYKCKGAIIGDKILDNINLEINAGEKIAIVGYNGAGKSTLIKLMTRLYDPDEGTILIDGIDIKSYETTSLRLAFGIVLQDFQHYAFSLAENIYPELEEDSVSDEQRIISAIKLAKLDKKVKSLPKGINSVLTKEFDANGVILSGGEFQKLSFARACVYDPHMLILDEVSSALDPVAENEINDVVLQNTRDKTVIFISHRLSAARMSDKILMLEHGKIIEAGTHQELMDLNGNYAKVFNIQAEKYVA